jgi:hypothetical protein
MKNILVVNAGSSSVKFQVFAVDGGGKIARTIKGQMDGIGTRPRLRASGPDGKSLVDREYDSAVVPDMPAALHTAGAWLRDEQRLEPSAVGHRVVHGGPTAFTASPMNTLPLACRRSRPRPRRGASLSLTWAAASPCARYQVDAASRAQWDLPCCGHTSGPDRPRCYSLPDPAEKHERRRGAGFPLARVRAQRTLRDSNDVRELQSSTDPQAAFALDYFCYRGALHAGMLAAALGGLDAFVFTA